MRANFWNLLEKETLITHKYMSQDFSETRIVNQSSNIQIMFTGSAVEIQSKRPIFLPFNVNREKKKS